MGRWDGADDGDIVGLDVVGNVVGDSVGPDVVGSALTIPSHVHVNGFKPGLLTSRIFEDRLFYFLKWLSHGELPRRCRVKAGDLVVDSGSQRRGFLRI